MKTIIYITVCICSLLFSSTLAAENRQISMTDMGLRVTASPESQLKDKDVWVVRAQNKFGLSEGEITNYLPVRISENLRSYVTLSEVKFTDSTCSYCDLYFNIVAHPNEVVQFVIKEYPEDFPIEISPISPVEKKQISMTDMGLRVTTSPESYLENKDVWVVRAQNKFGLSEGEITNYLPVRISENLRSYVTLSKVKFTDSTCSYCELYFNIVAHPNGVVRFVIKEYPKDFPIEISPITRENYISSTTYLSKGGMESRKEITYYNGLGYPSQKIEVGVSNDNKSIYHPFVYDGLMRDDAKSYLPYASETNAELEDKNFAANLQTFYAANQKENTYYFSEKTYENSPLKRVREIYGPGKDWRAAKASTRFGYLTNVSGNDTLNCLSFKIIEKENESMDVEVTGNYKSSELYVTRSENEGHLVTLEFKDKFGKVVLNRQIEHKTDNKINYDTYFLYDEFDNLKAVLPPMASDQMQIGKSYSGKTSAPLTQYAYLYKYDMRNRCIASKLPGCDWQYQIYDLTDHLAFSQTGEQRKKGEWLFSLNDAMGRECLTGICKNKINPFNNLLLNSSARCVRADGDKTYLNYSIKGIILDSAFILTAKYYDDYNFKVEKNNSIYYTELRYEEVAGFGEMYEASSLGLQTGSATARLDKNGSLAGYDYSTTYYDEKGRIIQTKSTNALDGYEATSTAYNFVGQPLRTEYIHTRPYVHTYVRLVEESKHTYDQAGRLSKTVKIINQTDSTSFAYRYDDLGNIKSLTRKKGAFSLTTTNTYNIRNWLTSIESPVFSQTLHYTDGSGTPQYNGSISSMTWKTASDTLPRNYMNYYDGLDRLVYAIYHGSNNLITHFNQFSEQVTGYDKQGNITGLKRFGQTGQKSYGLIDNLSLSYTGNQLKKVTDDATNSAYANNFEFKDGGNHDIEYAYDSNGNLTQDLNKNISNIQYNCLNLPCQIQFKDGSETSYLYNAVGTKLQTTHTIDGVTTTTDYCGNVIYENEILDKLLFDQGYVTFKDKKFHYYLLDHQGNNRVIIDQNGTVEEVNHYYPFGGIFASTSSVQPYKYNGKELDNKNGLGSYDYEARQYDPVLGRWNAIDPMAENDYATSTYAYCLNNPIKYIDPDGMQAKNPISGNVTLPEVTIIGTKVAEPISGFWATAGYYLLGRTQTFPVFGVSNGNLSAKPIGYITYNVNKEGIATSFVHQGGTGPIPARTGLKVQEIAKLLQAGKNASKGGLSAAGRALVKHSQRAGSAYPKAVGNQATINQQGEKILESILSNPNVKATIQEGTLKAGRYGPNCVDYRIQDGFGARFSADGTKFIGFLEPK